MLKQGQAKYLKTVSSVRAGVHLKLLILDVEGTLFKKSAPQNRGSAYRTVWQTIAFALGSQAIEAEIALQGRWRDGEFASYLEWVEAAVKVQQAYGLSREILSGIVESAEYNPGVPDTLRLIDQDQYRMILVSGGVRELATRAQRDFHIKHAFAACEYLFDTNGRIQSFNLLPCDFDGKVQFINLMLKSYGLSNQDWVFIGDGPNDVPVAKIAPMSIAYKGHAELRAVTTHSIDDFCVLLDLI
jgi:phosphoserine phosphatase